MRRLPWTVGLVPLAVFFAACGDDSTNPADGGPDATADSPAGEGGGDGGGDAAPPLNLGDSVLERNHHGNRDAWYVQPTFTASGIGTMARDSSFDGTISGHVYAQVLYVDNVALGAGATNWVIATTEDNEVDALDATTGAVVWQKTIGPNAASTGAGCGNVQPLGITGTPVIDIASRTMFLDAVIGTQANGSGTIKTHEIHALSIDDGSERPNFPVDASTASYQGTAFDPVVENQRAALAFVNGTAYVAYGGHAGDCGDYHGWVLGVPYPAGAAATAFATAVAGGTRAAGMWAPGGIADDGTDVYMASGNAFGASSWVGQEAIIRFHAGPSFSNQTADYFAPHNYIQLDNGDTDIGGSGPVLVTAKNATPSNLVVALGKNGYVYLLDESNLGGIASSATGDGVYNAQVASGSIINAAAWVNTSAGNTWLIAHGYNGASGVGCKTGSGDIIAMKISGSPPTASVEWCADSQTQGEPMITTSDANGSDATVWFVGQHLNGWDVETGNQVYTGSDSIAGVRRFTTPIAASGRIYIGADSKVYSFKL
jgi:hypothetical protein